MNLSKRSLFSALGLMTAGATASAVSAKARPAAKPEPVPFAVWTAVNTAVQGYADCIDRFDMAGLVDVFSPDCVYDYSPGLIMRGRAEVAAGARKSLANVLRSSHFIGSPVVEPGDAAGTFVSRVYFSAYHEQKDGGQHTVNGRYLDLFAPDATGRLLIAHRQTVSHTAQGITTPRYWLPRQPS
jgi:ketosteroid isomerase-like protein